MDYIWLQRRFVITEAAIPALESYRQEALEQKFREGIHRELDKWLDLLESVMDDALNLSSPRKQYDVQEAETDMAKEVPYEKASSLFCQIRRVAT